jgi:23S rRNA (cytosine1962-C5)-methyltransferase
MSCENLDSWPPCRLYEDEHLLVVNKPAGLNTHSPGPWAGEGIYDWLKHREPRWAKLAILHRLDKETSGLMVFGKTPLANRSLTEQFTRRLVRKKYLLLTDRAMPRREFAVNSRMVRLGERYASSTRGEPAETRFRRISDEATERRAPVLVEAEPLTGRTHQIRVQAADSGFPILGDTLYGGTPAPRVCLHAAELAFRHPATGAEVRFGSAPDFEADPRPALRAALIGPEATNAFRLVHGASDGWPGWYVDRLGDYLLSQSEQPLTDRQREFLKSRMSDAGSAAHGAPAATAGRRGEPRILGAYHKVLTRQVRRASAAEVAPQRVAGEAAPERFAIRENGVRFELSFREGYSVGLFLDQRDNRRRFLTGHVAAGFSLMAQERMTRVPEQLEKSGTRVTRPSDAGFEVLNTFAYTCGFSVCAALAGARTTSLDLSKKSLEWGKHNFGLNGLDPAAHEFLYGDAFDWLKRLAKRGRAFDAVVLDPPTFSQSKDRGVFRAEQDYGKLVALALPLLKTGGVLLASTNAAGWPAEKFLASLADPIRAARRRISTQHYAPQPPDFPISRAEPAHLKTVWLRIA